MKNRIHTKMISYFVKSAIGLACMINISSCGGTGAVTPPRIASGNALRDKIINGVRVQLKMRKIASQETIQSYLTSANSSASNLSIAGRGPMLALSAESLNTSQIVYGLIREIARLGDKYSFAIAAPSDDALALRASLIRYTMVYGRIFSGVDSSPSVSKAEFVRAFSYGIVSGFPGEGLDATTADIGISSLIDDSVQGVADTKWDDSALLSSYFALSVGAVHGLKAATLAAADRSVLFTKIVDDTLSKMKDLKVSTALKIEVLRSKLSAEISMIPEAGFSRSEVADEIPTVVQKGLAAIGAVQGVVIRSETNLAAAQIVSESISSFAELLSEAEMTNAYKTIADEIVKAFKQIVTTLPDGFGNELESKMVEAIDKSAVTAAQKAAAKAGTAKGIVKGVTGVDPDDATLTLIRTE